MPNERKTLSISIEGITEEVIAGVLTVLLTGGVVWIYRSLSIRTSLPTYDRLLWTMAWVALCVIVVFPIFQIETPYVIPILLMYLIATLSVRMWWHKGK